MAKTSPRQRPHRPGLSSIDDDDWDEEQPSSHKGRTLKSSSSSEGHRGKDTSGRRPQYPSSSSDRPYHYGVREDDVARAPRGRDSDRRIRNAERALRTGDEASSDSAISYR